jgi:hypothetical protein
VISGAFNNKSVHFVGVIFVCTFHVCQTTVTEQRSTGSNDVYLTGKKASHLYETQVSLPFSENFPTRPYPEKVESTPRIHTS